MTHEGKDPTRGAFAYVFIKPTMATLLCAVVLVIGVLALRTMTREGKPDLEIPIATVITSWPGSSAELVEKEITTELERALKGIEGVKKVTSLSQDSVSVIKVEFEATADAERSIDQVRTEVAAAEAQLPSDADKPEVEQVRVTDRPVVAFAVYGRADDAVLSALGTRLEDELERLRGVRDVETSGHREEIVQVLLHPERIQELGLPATAIAAWIQQANLDAALGTLEAPGHHARVDLRARFDAASDLEELVIARPRGSRGPITLGQVAEIRWDLEPPEQMAALSVGGRPFERAVILNVFKSPGEDTLMLVERAANRLETLRLQADWPDGVEVAAIDDQSEPIRETLTSTVGSVVQACFIVFLVLALLLSWREALVAGLAIPVTFLGSLGVLMAMGTTLNELVMIGLILAVGLLVDVFILVMEGMHEALAIEKLGFAKAVRRTVSVYALPALAGQLTTILALVPLFVIGGGAGTFIQVIPTTIIVALVVSFGVAFLLALPLSRYALRSGHSGPPSRIDRWTEVLTRRLGGWVRRVIVPSRGRSAAWVATALGLFVLSLWLGSFLDFTLFPKSDDPNIGVTIELENEATLEDSARVAEAVGELLRAQPEVETVARYVGRQSPMATGTLDTGVAEHYIGFSCALVAPDARERSSHALAEEWRGKLSEILANHPGATFKMHTVGGATNKGSPVQVIVYGDAIADLRRASQDVRSLLASVAGVSEVDDDLGLPQSGVELEPRREVLDLYGLTDSEVASQLRYAMNSVQVGTVDREGTAEPVELRLGTRWPSRGGMLGGPRSHAEILAISVIDAAGRRHSMEALGRVVTVDSTSSWPHRDGRRAVTIGASLAGRSARSVVEQIEPALAQLQAAWPGGLELVIGGESEDTAETFADVPMALVLAVGLVFVVLALVFGSFGQPLIILSLIPLGVVGTLMGFFFFDISMSFPAVVGIIALVGIVVNDSIVMVESMNHLRSGGASVLDAAARGSAERLRPIISTSLTTIGGMIPLVLSDPMWMPLAAAMSFGLLGSTAFAFVAVPALYAVLTPER